MKTKFYALLVAALLACNVFVANATRLYLMGTSTEAGWSLDLMDMMVEENGSHVWVGDLKDGSLKFMFSNMSFGDSYGATTADAPLTIGTAALGLNSNGTDNQFAVTAGRYSLTITLGENPTIVIADGTGLADKRIAAADIYPEALYAIGSATEAGWTPANAIQMAETEYGKYAGMLTLKAGENLEMKFLAQKGWGTQYGPQTDGEAITAAGEYSLAKATEGDPKYHATFTTDAYFSVTLDIAAGKMTLTSAEAPKLTTMWMIGDAVGGWNFDENGKEMTLNADSVWTWTGDLVAGEMKFCGIKWDYSKDAFGATVAATELKAGSLAVQAIDGDDKKFKVTEAGNYTLTLNLKTLTLNVVSNTSTANIDAEQTAAPLKTLRNGKVLILRDGVAYDLLGNIIY